MLEHIRRFVHDVGCVYLIVKQERRYTKQEQLEADARPITWSWCRRCNKVRDWMFVW